MVTVAHAACPSFLEFFGKVRRRFLALPNYVTHIVQEIMSISKPFHRNYRKVKEGSNSGYSDWAYIVDRDYAQSPEHYTRAFSIIQSDLMKLFEFLEPCDINLTTYSFRIHELLMRICIEVEANFKAILRENIYSPTYTNGIRAGQQRLENDWNINDFRKVNKTHHLDNYTVEFPYWKGNNKRIRPFDKWATNGPLEWYQAYNKSKHDRFNSFEEANFKNLLYAYSGLFVLLSSQFRNHSFSTGGQSLGVLVDSYYAGEFGIGGFLMIEFPTNWDEDEMYDFDWSKLKKESCRFQKINYNLL